MRVVQVGQAETMRELMAEGADAAHGVVCVQLVAAGIYAHQLCSNPYGID